MAGGADAATMATTVAAGAEVAGAGLRITGAIAGAACMEALRIYKSAAPDIELTKARTYVWLVLACFIAGCLGWISEGVTLVNAFVLGVGGPAFIGRLVAESEQPHGSRPPPPQAPPASTPEAVRHAGTRPPFLTDLRRWLAR